MLNAMCAMFQEFEEDPVRALRAKRETFLTGTSSDSEMKAFLQWKDLR